MVGAHFEHGRSEVTEESVLVVGVGLHELHCGAGSGVQGFVREEEPLARHQILVVLVVEADRRAGVQICRHVPVAVLSAQVLQFYEVGFLQRRIGLARVSLVEQSRLKARAARFADRVRACEIERVKVQPELGFLIRLTCLQSLHFSTSVAKLLQTFLPLQSTMLISDESGLEFCISKQIGTGKRDDISLIEPHGVETGDELGDVEARFGNGVCSGVLARRERITSSQLHIPERATTLQPTRIVHTNISVTFFNQTTELITILFAVR